MRNWLQASTSKGLPPIGAGQVFLSPVRKFSSAGATDRGIASHVLLAQLSLRVRCSQPSNVVLSLCKEGELEQAMDVLSQMEKQGVEASVNVYRSLLKVCAVRKALTQAKRVHAHLVKQRLDSSMPLGEDVVSTLAKCGDAEAAMLAFHKLPVQTGFSWTAVISGFTTSGQGRKALALYRRMRERGVQPNAYTFVSLLKACADLADLAEGKRIHAEALQFVCKSDRFLPNCLIDMYGKCGSIVDARDVFDRSPLRDVVSWTAMIMAYAHLDRPEEALQLYEQMLEEGASPNNRTFVVALQSCGMLAERRDGSVVVEPSMAFKILGRGKSIHAYAWGKGLESDMFVGNALITMYGRCRRAEDSWFVFDGLSNRNVGSWNAMLAAYIEQGQPEKVLQLYVDMKRDRVSPDSGTSMILLQACGIVVEREAGVMLDMQSIKSKALATLRLVHADITKVSRGADLLFSNALISAYQKCGSIVDAQKVFDCLVRRDVVTWNAMVTAYAQQSQAEKALQLYEQMLEQGFSPNSRTFVSVLQACGLLADKEPNDSVLEQRIKVLSLTKGKSIHAEVSRKGFISNLFVCSTLVSMYGKFGCIVEASDVFIRLSQLDVIAWSAMIAAHVEQRQAEKALQVFEQMLEDGLPPDERTCVSVFQALSLLAEEEEGNVVDGLCIKVESFSKGKALHAVSHRYSYAAGLFLASTLIDLYGKCGSVLDARNVFNELTHHNVVSWTAMIGACVEQGEVSEACQLYKQMQQEGLSPDEITLVCILQACSKSGNLGVLKTIHLAIISAETTVTALLGNTLIHAYGKCARMEDAQTVFDTLSHPDVVSWNALIAGHVRQGDFVASLQCYERMRLAGATPNEVTFLSLICACKHGGLVSTGMEYFVSLSKEYGLTPGIEHYVSIVDLLSHAGFFAAVEDLLSTMPMQPNLDLWLCLLSACRRHSKVDVAERAFSCAVRLQPRHPAAYMLMWNIYAECGLSDRAREFKHFRQSVGAWKKPGQSWIEHERRTHTFWVSDRRHSRHERVYEMLAQTDTELHRTVDCSVKEWFY